jgi:uncharacterized repeat protein (TIGR03847 family)
MRRRRRIVDLDAPERLVVVGPTSSGDADRFRIVATKGSRRASATIEREQLVMLAERVLLIIDELERRGLVAIEVGDAPRDPSISVGAASAGLRADTLAVEWDDDGERLVIEASAALPDGGAGVSAEPVGEPDPIVPDDEPWGPDILRVRLTPITAQRFARQARRLSGLDHA